MIIFNIYIIIIAISALTFLSSILLIPCSVNQQKIKALVNLDKYVNKKCKNIIIFAKNMESIIKRIHKENNVNKDYLIKNTECASYVDMSLVSVDCFNGGAITLNGLMFDYFIDDIDNIISDILEVLGHDRNTFKNHICIENHILNKKEESLKNIIISIIKRKNNIRYINKEFMSDIFSLIPGMRYSYYYRAYNIDYFLISHYYHLIMTYVFSTYGNYFKIENINVFQEDFNKIIKKLNKLK